MRNSTLRPVLVLYIPPPLSGRPASFPQISLLSYCHIACTPAPSLLSLSLPLSLFLCSQPLSFALFGNFPPSVSQTHPPPPHTHSSTLPFLFLLQNFAVGQLIIFPQLFFIRKMLSDMVSRSMPVGNDPSPIKSVSCFLSH